MKTKFSKAIMAIALGMTMTTASWAAQTTVRHEQVRTTEQKPGVVSRVGTTIWHTPSIIGETFKGERRVVSRQGLFARKPEAVAERSTTVSSSRQRSTMNKSSSHRSTTHKSKSSE